MDTVSVTAGELLRKRLTGYKNDAVVYDSGVVASVGDGVIQINGLGHCRYGELIEFPNNTYAMAMDLSKDGVGAVLISGENTLRVGEYAKSTGRVMEVPVGAELLGRIVNPIGMPLDNRALGAAELRAIEYPAPTIMQRRNIDTPMDTGILAVDSMIPIGRGQRELIIGDRQTGKTTLAVDCILNQRGKDVVCVYVAIGQKSSSVAHIREILTCGGAMEYSVIVAATAGDGSAMQYIAPYAGCAIAEHFMYSGRDVLIVYNDLSKHAVAYRAMSLLLRRPPGREAYPGDVFYLHSRLLERAACLSKEQGGGSMTALPVVETMAGDISAYITTNVISITDGQIFLDTGLFNAGIRPAVNVGLSVSRVGRSAQHGAMKTVSGRLRLSLAQYRELQIFSQFGTDIDEATRKLLDYGNRLTETLKQDQSSPYTLAEQVALLLSTDEIAELPAEKVRQWQRELLGYLRAHCQEQLEEIDRSGDIDDSQKEEIKKHIHLCLMMPEKEEA
jgi:proton translocating ATP synthase, F1 alpha subunit